MARLMLSPQSAEMDSDRKRRTPMNRFLASIVGAALLASPVIASAQTPAQPAATRTLKTSKHSRAKVSKVVRNASRRHMAKTAKKHSMKKAFGRHLRPAPRHHTARASMKK
jgi:hypothetical protein